MTSPPDWYAADRVYLDHHAGCPICRAAGKSPALQRCTEGAELWAAYQQAGMPPHFRWLARRNTHITPH
jgi:hypothetical protein